jgi:ribosomal protein L39E
MKKKYIDKRLTILKNNNRPYYVVFKTREGVFYHI